MAMSRFSFAKDTRRTTAATSYDRNRSEENQVSNHSLNSNRQAQTLLLRMSTVTALLIGVLIVGPAQAQLPLSPVREAGQTVTPAFEGWFPNADGTFSLSFGYFNRNAEQVIDVPIGEDNSFSPGGPDLGQPTRFYPRRHWGVFTITVPADFGDTRLVWTLRNGGETFEVPGHLEPDWLLDAERDPASGNIPPVLKFAADGPEGSGPDGIVAGPLEAKVGEPFELVVWATDDEVYSRQRQPEPIILTWFKHRGPGEVTLDPETPEVDKENGGRSATSVSFSEPGDYVLRVRATDYSGLSSAGHSQCCWSNGFVKITVSE